MEESFDRQLRESNDVNILVIAICSWKSTKQRATEIILNPDIPPDHKHVRDRAGISCLVGLLTV